MTRAPHLVKPALQPGLILQQLRSRTKFCRNSTRLGVFSVHLSNRIDQENCRFGLLIEEKQKAIGEEAFGRLDITITERHHLGLVSNLERRIPL